jgi:uncharacterized protein
VAFVVCHPHPLFGGSMHSKVLYQVSRTLDRLGLPSLRFNFRGVGGSAGQHDAGRGEQDDVRAALDFLSEQFPGVALGVAGFSFGCYVGLRVGCREARVAELVGLGAPVNASDFSFLASCDKPRLFVQGEHDEHGAPEKLRQWLASAPPSVQSKTQLVIVPHADHFFAKHLGEVDAALQSWLRKVHSQIPPG